MAQPVIAPMEAPTTRSGRNTSANAFQAPAWYEPYIPPADRTSAVIAPADSTDQPCCCFVETPNRTRGFPWTLIARRNLRGVFLGIIGTSQYGANRLGLVVA